MALTLGVNVLSGSAFAQQALALASGATSHPALIDGSSNEPASNAHSPEPVRRLPHLGCMLDQVTYLPVPRTPTPSWRPKRVLITRSARDFRHGRIIAERASALGSDVIELKNDRVAGLLAADSPREEYRQAKSTLAIVVASPAKRRLQPIPPSADWRFNLAEGCPAHCQYCYLAGSLAGPPVTRVYANIHKILGSLPDFLGLGKITSVSADRAHEGTTFEASCYTYHSVLKT